MKKSLLKKILLFVFIASVSAFTLTSHAQNLLTINPSFEQGTGSGVGSSLNGGFWSRVNAGNATGVQNYIYRESVNPTAQNETYYAKAVTPAEAGFNTPSALQTINTQNLTTSLVNGKTYRISFYYQNSASHTFKAVVENNNGTTQVASHQITTEATSWTYTSFEFTLNTATLTDGRLKLQFGSNAGTTLVDNVKIEDVATLPVVLSRFSVMPQATSVAINWETASEINNAAFEIWRSANGQDYSLLKSVKALNQPSKYTVADNAPLEGINYYKLLQWDNNGNSAELALEAISFDLSGRQTVLVYPNPAANSFNLKLNSPQAGNVQISIVNANGEVLQQDRIEKVAGNSVHTILLRTLKNGMYIVKIKGIGLDKTFKLAVQ